MKAHKQQIFVYDAQCDRGMHGFRHEFVFDGDDSKVLDFCIRLQAQYPEPAYDIELGTVTKVD